MESYEQEEFLQEKNMIGGNNESFFSYMFSLSQKDKMEIMNIVQYIGLAFVPIIILVYWMKLYLPSFDPYKGNIEILVEVLIQLVVLIVFFWFIHRFIMFIPTYSKENYSTMNVFHFIIPFLFVLFTLETNVSKKVNLLLKRVMIYLGLEKEHMQDVNTEEEEIYTPPSIQLPCPGPMNNPYPQNTKEEAKNYNNMYEKTTNKLVGARQARNITQ